MIYREYPPNKHFQKYIFNYWKFEVDEEKDELPVLHETLPEYCSSIVLILQPDSSNVRIIGPRTESFTIEIEKSATYLGIRIQPWVQFLELDKDPASRVNMLWDAPESLKESFAIFEKSLRANRDGDEIKIFDELVSNLFSNVSITYDPIVEQIDNLINTNEDLKIKVKDITSKIHLSERQIQKRFKKTTALTIKNYLDIYRFRKATLDVYQNQKEFTSVILANGYYDQPHYLRLFNHKMSQSWKSFKKHVDTIEHPHLKNDGFLQE